MEEGTIVAALTGMAFVMLGIFQFLKGYITSTNKDYQDLRDKYEALQTQKIELETNNLYWKNRALLAEKRKRLYRRKLTKCHETIQQTLLKTRPIPPLSEGVSEDETIVP